MSISRHEQLLEYRRVFGFRKYDSVRLFIAGIGRLDFAHLRLLSVLRFIKKAMSRENGTLCFVSNFFTLSEEFLGYCGKCSMKSADVTKMSVQLLEQSVTDHLWSVLL